LTKTVVETAPGRIVLVIAQVIGELFVERRRRTQAARMSPRCLPRLQHRRPHPSPTMTINTSHEQTAYSPKNREFDAPFHRHHAFRQNGHRKGRNIRRHP
jgi:hypothetical protein